MSYFDEYRIKAWPLATRVIGDFLRDKPEKPIEGQRCVRWHIRKVIEQAETC